MHFVHAERYKLSAMSASEFFADENRASGAHISNITRSLDMEFFPGKFKSQKGQDSSGRDEEQIQDWAEIGWLWENILQSGPGGWGFRDRMLKRRQRDSPGADIHLQDAYSHSGVGLTPDGLDTSDAPIWIEEYKATRKSIRHWQRNDLPWGEGWEPEPKWVKTFFEWLSRVMGYCYVTGATRCRFFVYWVCGDWKGSGPQTWRYDIEFEPREIRDNWRLVLSHGIEKKIITGDAAVSAYRSLKRMGGR